MVIVVIVRHPIQVKPDRVFLTTTGAEVIFRFPSVRIGPLSYLLQDTLSTICVPFSVLLVRRVSLNLDISFAFSAS